jgi:hypothetical protein
MKAVCAMAPSRSDDQYPPDEAQRRFEALVRAAINTPPQHRPAKTGDETPVHTYVVVDGVMRVAAGRLTPGSEATVDLYRNLDDLRAGRVLEPGVAVTVAG